MTTIAHPSADRLERLSARLDALDVDPSFQADAREAWLLASGLDPYTSRCTTPESAGLPALARRAQDEDRGHRSGESTVPGLEPELLSGHVEGQRLKLLVHATKARRVLEIGMSTGHSALAMAEPLPVGGQVVACEFDAGVARLAQECFAQSPAGDRIVVRIGPALDTLAALAEAGEVFDLVFLDADKPGYVEYYRTLLDRGLLAPGALMCLDNTLMQGEPYPPGQSSANGRAIATFNQVVAEDPRVEQVLLPVRDGLTLIRAR